MTMDELTVAWDTNNNVNAKLLELCADEDFELKPGKGKTIRSNFVHIVQSRKSHLEARMKRQAEVIPKLDWQTADRVQIQDALSLTNDLMVLAFERQEQTGKPQRWTTLKFFAYCIAHEAHHRSQIEIALRVNGREPAVNDLYALWDWPKL